MSETEDTIQGGIVTNVESGSLADQLGVRPDDILLKVNGESVADVIDVQYYAAEYQVELLVNRAGQEYVFSGERDAMQPFGLEFAHPTFDIDIRRCNNLCEFCFVLQMAPRFRQTLYIKDDDYRYSFLFGHFVTLTNLTDHDKWRIVEQGLSPLYVSVHATDLTLRRELLRNADAPDIIEQLSWLTENDIQVHTQIVVTPGVNDGLHLEQSVRNLAALWPGVESVSVVPVGLTKHHKYKQRPNTRDEAQSVLDAIENWQAEFRDAFDVNFAYPTDEWYLVAGQPIPGATDYDRLDLTENGLGMVRRFMDDWLAVKSELSEKPTVKALTLATATLFALTLSEFAVEFADLSRVNVEVVPIINEQLGDTITVAGLLMGEDVIRQLKTRDLSDVVVLPRIMFDHPDGISLDDVTPLEIARTLGRPVALVDMMGDLVDIIYGRPSLYFDPEMGKQVNPDEITKDGGWSVEKYL